jgi:hypothetical protein
MTDYINQFKAEDTILDNEGSVTGSDTVYKAAVPVCENFEKEILQTNPPKRYASYNAYIVFDIF